MKNPIKIEIVPAKKSQFTWRIKRNGRIVLSSETLKNKSQTIATIENIISAIAVQNFSVV